MKYLIDSKDLPERVNELNLLNECVEKLDKLVSRRFDLYQTLHAKLSKKYVVEKGEVLLKLSNIDKAVAIVTEWNQDIQKIRELSAEIQSVYYKLSSNFDIEKE